jgi:hypothetical protein
MRSLLLAALAAAVFTASASASHSNGTGPKNDLATGSGKFATTSGPGGISTAMEFSFSAHRTESGIHGNVNFRGVDFTGAELNGKGQVECFDVRDNRAFVIFEFKDVRPFGGAVQHGALALEDNGQPSDSEPDRAIAAGITGGQGEPLVFPRDCLRALESVSGFATLPVESGNVTVHEGT